MSKDFEVDDLVWAKMKGFQPWPGKIALPITSVKPPKLQKSQHFVYFFGTHNYAWILDENITPHSAEMLENAKNYKKKAAKLQSGIEEIESEMQLDPPSSPGKESVDEPTTSTESPAVVPVKKVKSTPKKATPNKKRSLANSLPSAKKRKTKDPQPESEASASSMGDPSPSKVAIIPPYVDAVVANNSGISIIDRPHYPRPPTPPLVIDDDMIAQKNVRKTTAAPIRVGFLGLGMMGRGMVKNLLRTGHDVTLWNRSADKCTPFVEAGAREVTTPSDVVAECDITFSCVADPQVAKSLVFGNCGVLSGLASGGIRGAGGKPKGYVEMTSLDPATSQEIAEAVSDRGGRYLEAPVIGSRELADAGDLLVLGAGDRDLFDQCETCFFAIAKMAFYLSCEVGIGTQMNLVFSMLRGATMAAMAEAIAMVETCNLPTEHFQEILGMSGFEDKLWQVKSEAMLNNTYTIGMALKHQQKDMSLAVGIGNAVQQPLPVSASANEVYKRAKLLGYAEHDVGAVHLATKI